VNSAPAGLPDPAFGALFRGHRSLSGAGVVIPLVTAVIALATFVTMLARSAHPLLPLRILASRNRGGAYLSITLAMLANFGAFLFLTCILRTIEHLTPQAAGVGFLPLTVINGLASTQVASRLLARFHKTVAGSIARYGPGVRLEYLQRRPCSGRLPAICSPW
jgi:hypothetical protein